MKGHKGEGAKQNQAKGTLGAADKGPLFPRLHVNETEKAGPKAPPRNKMALYEQFTVPSHRLVQASQTPANPMYQQQYGIREFGYPYVPYYMPSVPYTNTNHGVSMYTHPSHNTSSSGVTISSGFSNEDLGRAAPRHNRAGKSCVSRHSTETSADCTAKNLPEPKGKVAILQSQSSLTNQAEELTSSLQKAPSDMQRPQIEDITESLQETLSTVEVTTDCTVPDARRSERPRVGCFIDKSISTCVTREGTRKQAAQLSIFETMTKPAMGGASEKANVELCWATESARHEWRNDGGMLDLTTRVHGNVQSGAPVDLKDSGDKVTVNADSQSILRCEYQATSGPQYAPTSDEISENNVHKRSLKNSTTNMEKLENRTDVYSNQSSEEPNNFDNRNSEVLQLYECGTLKEGDADGVIVPSTVSNSMSAIKPKDVIRAIGQQQFWKARKKLLRQQRIFSDQVFQLHKLIKVQQLLAETPDTFIDEEMDFELEEEFDATTPSAKMATNSGDDANKVGFNIKEDSEGKLGEPEGQPKSDLGHTQADANAGSGSNKSMPEFSPVGVSAWGYPSLGVVQWGGSMAAQGGPFSYQPFGGTAFGWPFGPSMPFGIPFCDRRQELPAEVDSNYGPPSAFKHEGSGTGSVNSSHLSNDLAASWYFTQYNNMNNQRLLAGGSGRDVPTGSGASVNKSSATPQAVKTSCFPGLSQNWGLNSQTGPSNADGLDKSTHQSENSSRSNATRPNCRTSSTPSTSPARWPGIIHQNAERQSEIVESSSADNDGGELSVEKEKVRPSSQSRRRTDTVCLSVDHPSSSGNDYPFDMNHSALDLFPLVPSMSPISQRGEKANVEGQGGVIRAVPRRATAASKSAAGILLSLQQERQK